MSALPDHDSKSLTSSQFNMIYQTLKDLKLVIVELQKLQGEPSSIDYYNIDTLIYFIKFIFSRLRIVCINDPHHNSIAAFSKDL